LKKNEEKKALDYFEKSIEIKNELQRKTYNQLAPLAVYSTLGKYYLAKKEDEKARFFAHLSLAETLGDIFVSKSVVIEDYFTLYKIYKRRKMTDSALFYHEKYLKVKDELEKENQLRKITGLEVEAATEKQERENQILKQKDKLNRLEIEERERNLRISVAGLAALCLVVFYVIYLNRAKQRANALLKLQKDEISEKNAELSVQKEEILSQALHLEEANIAITKQKNKIEESHREITASITYAQRIQNAVLPLEEEISGILPAFFVLFCPRDIVSGDFYLIKKTEGKTLIVAADCTGHGVPGAFMSMLGTALLNEIFGKNPHASAAEMLNNLRSEIKKALRQEGKTGEQQDGMDIALCLFDEKNQLLNFAGAHNPLLIFRESEMFELKASRMPIGIYKKEKDFDNQFWECQKNDRFYIFSDGFYSQFHHETRQALKSKAFKNLLADIHILDFEEQKRRLLSFLADWQRKGAQTDDILLIGFSFCPSLQIKTSP
jgi:serine phosphatase RsbU (regulator of sigma subunit)